MTSGTHCKEEDLRDPSRPTIVLKPVGKHTATVIILHGLGDSARGWLSGAELFAQSLPHVKFVLPTAPSIPITLQGGMPATAWCDIPIRSPLEIQNAITSKPGHIDASVCEIAKLIAQECQGGIPPSRVVLVGFSLGGCAAAWTALQVNFALAGLVMLSSAVLGDVNIKMSAVCTRVPVLQCHGSADFMIPLFGAKLSQQRLEASGMSVDFHEFLGGHEMNEEPVAHTLRFLTTRLPQGELSAAELEEASKAAAPGALLPPGLGPDDFRIPNDVSVTIRGLKSQPQHNGVTGTVVGFNAASGRYAVRLDGVEAALALKPQNLTQHIAVTILLDSTSGTLLDHDDETGLFSVRLSDNEVQNLPVDAVRLPQGAVVRVLGLTSEKGMQLNDRSGRITGFNEEEQRYVVNFGGEKHKIKPTNLLP